MVPRAHPNPQPKGNLIGSAVYAGLTIVQTDKPTDHAARSVGRIYTKYYNAA